MPAMTKKGTSGPLLREGLRAKQVNQKEIKILTFFANLCLRTTTGAQKPNTTLTIAPHLLCLFPWGASPRGGLCPPAPALPGEQVLAADTQGRLVVLGHTHLVRAALHLQAGVFGWVQG